MFVFFTLCMILFFVLFFYFFFFWLCVYEFFSCAITLPERATNLTRQKKQREREKKREILDKLKLRFFYVGFISHRAWFPIFYYFCYFLNLCGEDEKYVFIDCSFCVSSTFRMFTHISHSHTLTLPLSRCLFLPSYSDLFIKQAVQVLPICPHTPKVDFHAGVALCCFVSLNEYE